MFPEFVHPAVPDSDTGSYDDFALLTRAGSDDFVDDAGGEYFSFVLVRIGPGDDTVESRLPRSFSALGPTNLPENLRNLGRVEGFPRLIGGFLVLLAMVAIAHTLVTSVRRRAHDLAVLETIGFVHRQVRSTIVWQASTLAAIGLVLGIPIGIVVGRLLWSFTATSLGVDTSVDLPWGWIALTIPVTLVLVNLLASAAGPGRDPSASRGDPPQRVAKPSVVEDGEVELGEALGVGERVDLDDLAVAHGERHHRGESPTRHHDRTGGTVDQRRPHVRRQPAVGERARRDLLRAADDAGHVRPARPTVGPQHDVGVEDGDQSLEVAVTRRREERVDDLALPGEVGVGLRCTLHPTAGAARELACRRRCAVHDRRDLVEGHGEHVVQHEREALGRLEHLEHDEQREADRVGEERLLLGVDAVRRADDRVGHERLERVLPAGAARERSMLRLTRATTVVSQPPRFSISSASERLRRSHASCTASSASLSEPSIR